MFSNKRRLSRAGLILSLGLCGPLWTTSLHATSGVQFSMSDLIGKSALIAQVRVRNVDPTQYNAARAEPATLVEFDVLRVLHGSWKLNQVLRFLLPGGVASDGSRVVYMDMPQFSKGRNYLVFVGAGPWFVTPFTNWKYSVFREEAITGRTYLVDMEGRAVDAVKSTGIHVGAQLAAAYGFYDMLTETGHGDDTQSVASTLASDPSSVSSSSTTPSPDATRFPSVSPPASAQAAALVPLSSSSAAQASSPIAPLESAAVVSAILDAKKALPAATAASAGSSPSDGSIQSQPTALKVVSTVGAAP